MTQGYTVWIWGKHFTFHLSLTRSKLEGCWAIRMGLHFMNIHMVSVRKCRHGQGGGIICLLGDSWGKQLEIPFFFFLMVLSGSNS